MFPAPGPDFRRPREATVVGLLKNLEPAVAHGLQAGLVISERHGQWTFDRRDENNIEAFLATIKDELLNR